MEPLRNPQKDFQKNGSPSFWFFLLVALGIGGFFLSPFLILHAPSEKTMGLIQKIFYFHVSCAWITMLSALICGLSSVFFLFRNTETADRIAVASAELVVLFGLCVLVTGPLWAKKAWGTYWQWDVRLTTTLLLWLIFVIYLFCRRYAGPDGKKLGAGLAIFGMVDVPLIYISVSFWRTIHPKTSVVSTLDPAMKIAFWSSMVSFSFLFFVLLSLRIRLQQLKVKNRDLCIAMDEEGITNEFWEDSYENS